MIDDQLHQSILTDSLARRKSCRKSFHKLPAFYPILCDALFDEFDHLLVDSRG